MNELTRDISPEDRRKLADALHQQSAAQSGHSPDNFRQRIVNGKYQWVKQAQLLQDEERKKRVLAASRPVRALRDGENSLVSLIHKSLATYLKQSNDAKRMGYINDMESMDCNNAIQKIQTRTETFADELGEVENKIELTKSQNPVIIESEKLLLLLSQLKQRGETDKMQQLQKQNTSLLLNYQNQRKSLSPLIEHARQLRADLQREYWRAMQALWNLRDLIYQKDFKTLSTAIEALEQKDFKLELVEELQEIKQQFEDLIERESTLLLSLPSNMQQPVEGAQSWDEILPVKSSMLDGIEFMIEVLKSITAKIEPSADEKSTHPRHRMAFTSDKKR